MVLRTVLGEGPDELLPAKPLDPRRLVLAGTRAPDPGESAYLETAGITVLAEPTAASIVAAVEATGAASVYLHIDLDVLDPAEIEGIGFPEPFGMTAGGLVECIGALLERWPLAGGAITEFAPASPQDAVTDLPTILRIIGALTKPRT
jgi:arginase